LIFSLMYDYPSEPYLHHRYLPSFPTRRSSDLLSSERMLGDLRTKVRSGSIVVFHANGKGLHTRAVVEDLSQELLKKGLQPLLRQDRKSTRLNSSHGSISYAVFCLKNKKQDEEM